MSFVLLAPLALFALAALALPLAIHLVRRPDPASLEFAALRWISPRQRPQRRWRFERPWLLLLRLALLGAIVLLLARPAWIDQAPAARARAFAAPGVDRAAVREAMDGRDVELHWLAPGFPPFEAAPPDAVPLASLLREADAQVPAEARLTVVVPRELAGLDGERVALSHAVEWIVVPGAMRRPPAPIASPVRFAVRHGADTRALPYLRAAVAAWNGLGGAPVQLDEGNPGEPLPADARWLAWLEPEVPQAIATWIAAGGHALLVQQGESGGEPLWRDGGGEVVARTSARGRGRVVALRGALQPADLPQVLDATFPQRLRDALEGDVPAPSLASAADVAPIKQTRVAVGSDLDTRRRRPLDARLGLLVALLFLLERVLAGHRPDPHR
jgi:aerotolerance regulator-like protein